jgi:hypothetical protein
MRPLLAYLVLCALPAAVFLGLARLVDWLAEHPEAPRDPDADPAPTGRSLQLLVATLRRLEEEYDALERARVPARAHRLEAITLAYDDTLLECCAALGLPPPDHSPLTPSERVQTQAELSLHGLTW